MASHIRRLNQRRDKTEPEIVEIFERYGATCLKGEELDLHVHLWGEWFAVECKSEGGRPTATQRPLLKLTNTYLCHSAEEAMGIINMRKQRLEDQEKLWINVRTEKRKLADFMPTPSEIVRAVPPRKVSKPVL